MKRSKTVRQTAREWLSRRSITRFEEEWIAALRERPETAREAEDWLDAQDWSKK